MLRSESLPLLTKTSGFERIVAATFHSLGGIPRTTCRSSPQVSSSLSSPAAAENCNLTIAAIRKRLRLIVGWGYVGRCRLDNLKSLISVVARPSCLLQRWRWRRRRRRRRLQQPERARSLSSSSRCFFSGPLLLPVYLSCHPSLSHSLASTRFARSSVVRWVAQSVGRWPLVERLQ